MFFTFASPMFKTTLRLARDLQFSHI